MLKFAIPNKGALSEEAILLLKEAGYKCSRYSRELVVTDRANDIDFFFLRPRDIALYVGNGIIDLGITGRDLAVDSLAQVAELMELGFGKSTFRYAVPADSDLAPENFDDLRIATSYPNVVAADLAKRNIKAKLVKLDGAVEISIRLGVADAIADVVESGRTLVEAGLKVVGEPLLVSEALLIGRNSDVLATPEAAHLAARLRGILVAREYAIVEYEDIEKVMDVIGGVEVDVPFDMIYDDPTDTPPLHIRIYAGEQTIDSSNVMEYLRYRKGYRNGDIGRIQVHQEFVKKVIKECLKAGNILDVAKVAVENVESDITYSMAISVATKAFKLSGDSINSYVLPGTDAMIQGFSFWQPNEDGIFAMLEEIYRIGSGEEGDLSIPTTIRLLEKPTLNRNYLPKGDGTVIDIEFDSQGNVVTDPGTDPEPETDPEPVEGSEEGSEPAE